MSRVGGTARHSHNKNIVARQDMLARPPAKEGALLSLLNAILFFDIDIPTTNKLPVAKFRESFVGLLLI